MAAKIVFNGKEYDSVESMPPDVRQTYQNAMSMLSSKTLGILKDADNNGVPDILEKLGTTSINFSTSNRMIVYEGKTYNSVDELPAETREKYRQAMAKLGGDADNDGIPDVLEGKVIAGAEGSAPVISVNTLTTSAKPIRLSTTVSASSNTWLWLVIVAALLALVATLAVLLVLK